MIKGRATNGAMTVTSRKTAKIANATATATAIAVLVLGGMIKSTTGEVTVKLRGIEMED